MFLTFNEMALLLEACRALSGRKVPFAYELAKNVKRLQAKVDEEREIFLTAFADHSIKDGDKAATMLIDRLGEDEHVLYNEAEHADKLRSAPDRYYTGHVLDEESVKEGSSWKEFEKEFLERKHEVEIHKIKESKLVDLEIEPDLLYPFIDYMVES